MRIYDKGKNVEEPVNPLGFFTRQRRQTKAAALQETNPG